MKAKLRSDLHPLDTLLLWVSLPLWLAIFLVGTLVNSAPYRNRFASFEGGVVAAITDGLMVLLTYTLTNVAFLCILAGLLGAIGAKAILESDTQQNQVLDRDTTSPKSSAVLRSFLVYLALIAGVLILGDNPAEPTQIHYVRLAGLMSLTGFVVNYRPTIFGRLLERAGRLFGNSHNQLNTGIGAGTKPKTPDSHPELVISPANELVKLAELRKSGVLSDREFQKAKERTLKD